LATAHANITIHINTKKKRKEKHYIGFALLTQHVHE